MPRVRSVNVEPVEAKRALAREIGERIRAHRVGLGMTQQQVAEPVFSKAYISALETGIARPSMRALRHIAEKLNVSPSQLLEEGVASSAASGGPIIVWVRVGDGRIYAELDDGREVGVPLKDPTLRRMRIEDLGKWRIAAGGRAVVWPKGEVTLQVRELFGLSDPEPVPGPSVEEIGERIRRAREERGLTQAQVAGPRFTGGYIGQIELARITPSITALAYIADRLRIRRSELLGGAESSAGGSAVEAAPPLLAQGARIMDDRLYVTLEDGRELGLPLELIPKLLAHSMDELSRWSIARAGASIRWSALNFEILIDEYGHPSLRVG